jgi:Family of unknown function (DUF6893)
VKQGGRQRKGAAGSGTREINLAGPLSRTGREQEEIIRALGYATAVTMAAAGAALGVLAVTSLPDMRRYLAMRKM